MSSFWDPKGPYWFVIGSASCISGLRRSWGMKWTYVAMLMSGSSVPSMLERASIVREEYHEIDYCVFMFSLL